MSEKFSIATTINTSILDIKIDRYLNSNKEEPYIFMNEDTVDAITYTPEVIPRTHYKNGVVGKYCGYKVFLDNDLKFGEVEIR